MANQRLVLDLTGTNNPNPIIKGHIKDGQIKATDVWITDNGLQKDLTAFAKGQFRGTNAAGEFVVLDIPVTAKDGKFTCTFPKTTFSQAGRFKQAYFVFWDKNNNQISTADFEIIVIQDADVDAQHADELIDEYNKFVKALQDAFDKAKQKLDADVTAFEKRIAADEAAFDKAIKDKEAAFNKSVADLQAKIDALKAQIDSLDIYTKKQADSRFLIVNNGTIGADTDWNTANKTGIYHVNQAKGPNCPTGSASATWGDLLVIANGGWIEQHYFGATSGGHEYVRTYSGDPATWGKWYNSVINDELNLEYGKLKTIDKPDFNTLTTVGNYYVTNPQSGKNGPTNMTAWGRLEVRSAGVAYNQIYHSDTNNQIWSRNYLTTTKTWTAWEHIYTSADAYTRAEIDSKVKTINGTINNEVGDLMQQISAVKIHVSAYEDIVTKLAARVKALEDKVK